MNLTKPYTLHTGIGFDIGDGITNFIINSNLFLPINKTDKFIIENDKIKIYEGINNLSKNNKLLDTLNIKKNNLYYLNITIICDIFIILSLTDRLNNTSRKIIRISMFNKHIEEKEDLNNIKLKFIFKNTKNNIINKMNTGLIKFNDILKNNIINKLNKLDNDINTMENQQIMNKINILKEKFLL